MSYRQLIFAIAAASLLLNATGCSLFAPRSEKILVDSDPQGAIITIPGYDRMVTPATFTVPCDEDITVIARKDGYRTQSCTVRRTLGKCGTLDVFGTVVFLLPAVGLFSSGAYTLDQHTIFFPLSRSSESAETTSE